MTTREGGRRAAVLGSPIAHSLSPVLHRAAYDALGLHGWTYEAVECDEAGLGPFLADLDPAYAGLSLTMPLKAAVLPLLDTVTPLAEVVEAANTVVLADGGRHGHNTDVPGMEAALTAAGVVPGERPVVLGAGGTARSAVAALARLGADHVDVVVRDPARARALVETGERLGVPARPAAWPGVDVLGAATLVVSTVPAGAADALAGAGWPPGRALFDVLYHPWPTALARAALAGGAPVVGGLELLVQQAVLQVELMTGRRPPLEALATAGRAALAERQG